tara:strand:- start:341 stop:502 length:162 start_codon:yes stop_codon:yes gene_type:complete
MEPSPLLKALQLAEQSRIEQNQRIQAILADLPEDFDWDQLEKLLSEQTAQTTS